MGDLELPTEFLDHLKETAKRSLEFGKTLPKEPPPTSKPALKSLPKLEYRNVLGLEIR